MSNRRASKEAGGLWDQFHRVFRWLRLLLIVAVAGFFVVFALEAVRIVQTAWAVSPYLGYAVLAGMLGLGALVFWPGYRYLQMPHVVQPPELPAADTVERHHLRAEVRYLDRYLANCGRNPELADKLAPIASARSELATIVRELRAASADALPPLDERLRDWTGRTMPAILADVDSRADRLIYQEALAVGLATAASPNGTLDAFVMLWRSVNLASKLAQLYYGRPGVWGTLAVCRDVAVATAMAGYLQGISDSLGGLVAKSVGGVTGIVAGPAVDGVTNALVLIRIGYLAKERCRSFRKWDVRGRHSALLNALGATQKVAIGLTTEIVRQVGSGLTTAAGAAASGVAKAAGAAADKLSAVANSALSSAVEFGQAVVANVRRRPEG